ncbi:MAG: hypothetical protein R2704_00690 [Microthrixaceae bacterium]
MANATGPLGAADEGFNHQIADTFATVGTSDPAWTEKVCAMALARDGSLQLGFGMGQYRNRNVMDAYAGVSRGVEQLTVRSSRRLYPDDETTAVGPITYDVIEPMRTVRFALAPNDVQPLSFDWTFTAALPPQSEERTHQRAPLGYRVSAELVRYHQMGTASGWVELDGERTEFSHTDWVSTRDHSWGVRYDVGTPPTDTDPFDPVSQMNFYMLWSPILMEDPDGTRWGLFLHLIDMEGFGHSRRTVNAHLEHADGTIDPIADLTPDLAFDSSNRRLKGGTITATMADGSTRRFSVEVPTDTGFHLGAGLYFGWKGHHHGEWRGELHTDGERLTDTSDAGLVRDLHQIRDTAVVVTDLDTGARGVSNMQPLVAGEHPELGLDAAGSFW